MAKGRNHSLSASCLDCLAMLESNISVLYTAASGRVPSYSEKAFFRGMSIDGQKHSAQLKAASEQLAKMKAKNTNNDMLEALFNMTYAIYKDLVEKEEAEEQLQREELLALSAKLLLLEETLCQKYAGEQARTLRSLGRDSPKMQHFRLDNFGSMFERLIDDSEQHQKILGHVLSVVGGTSTEGFGFSVETTLVPAAQAVVEPQVSAARHRQ